MPLWWALNPRYIFSKMFDFDLIPFVDIVIQKLSQIWLYSEFEKLAPNWAANKSLIFGYLGQTIW
jgi:hypothetical protein